MNNSIDINEVDKTKFKCFKFPDSSIYFGEIGYMDPITHAVLLEKDLNLLSEDKIKLLKIVRHGVGVQLFDVNDTESLCRYEGEWVKDKKNGRGNCYFSDNSVYEGSFVNDLFEGHGKYSWPNNDIYIGIWKAGRMEGEGEFKHSDGHILKGMFKNNYYFDVSLYFENYYFILFYDIFYHIVISSEFLQYFLERKIFKPLLIPR